jgi:hypothetical protein
VRLGEDEGTHLPNVLGVGAPIPVCGDPAAWRVPRGRHPGGELACVRRRLGPRGGWPGQTVGAARCGRAGRAGREQNGPNLPGSRQAWWIVIE